MTRLRWETVEVWQACSEMAVWELRLQRVDDVWTQAWRVEWGPKDGWRKRASFAGQGREDRARAELQRRMKKIFRVWRQVA